MSKESQSAEAASAVYESEAESCVSDKSIFHKIIFGVLAAVYDLSSLVLTRSFRVLVLFGTWFHSKVIIPTSVFGVSFSSVISELCDRTRYGFRFFSHKCVTVAGAFRRNRIALAISLLSVALITIASCFYSVGIRIIVDGRELGYMSGHDEYSEAVELVEARAGKILGRPYSITENVRFELDIVPREKIISKDALSSYFFSKIDEVSHMYTLKVDGEIVGASYKRESLQSILDRLLYVSDPSVRASFGRNVEISRQYVDASKITSDEELYQKLTSKIHSQREYTILSGDSIESIAKANGISSEDLIALNPEIESGKLIAGETLTVAKEVPFLSIEAVRRVEYTETIPFETKTVEDSSIYQGTTKVVTKGKSGTRRVVADVTYIDNVESSREIISSTVTAEPVTKVVHKGTKVRPKTMATGSFIRPVRGAVLTSNYGMRRGTMHKGIDLAARSGTKIIAADGGTVTWAGWKSGGWGYLVVIDHGNGLETYYAHNSKITVKVGQKVAKGEQIAKMGSTGNSTGPHCHFEVHKNGKYQNPWNYIS